MNVMGFSSVQCGLWTGHIDLLENHWRHIHLQKCFFLVILNIYWKLRRFIFWRCLSLHGLSKKLGMDFFHSLMDQLSKKKGVEEMVIACF